MLDLLELYNKIRENQNWITSSAIKELRMVQYRLTQAEFARLLMISLPTLQNWERGRYSPSSPARSLLLIAKDYPEIFMKNRKKILTLFSKFS